MSYREPLPEGCPPDAAEGIAASREVFRLVRNTPPTLDDFRSQRAEKPQAVFQVSECQARGLSVFADLAREINLPAAAGNGRWPNPADGPAFTSYLVAAGRLRHSGAWWSGNRMKTIRHTTTLFYYDGPQVFEARDAIGGHYVAVMVEPHDGQDRYLVAGVEPERLRQFRAGLLDLRSLLTERGVADWFLAFAPAGLAEPLALQMTQGSLVESAFLPDAGFVLHDRPAEELALREARVRNNLVFELAVEPPEAVEEHRIRVGTLVGLLNHVQMMVKHAYGAALRDLALSTRRAIDRSNAHLMDVVIPATEGSFRIVLEAAKTPDLLGQNELARALERVDALFEKAANPEQAAAVVRANSGHLAGACLRLLRFLIQHNTGLRYSWAEPTFSKPRSRSISEGEATPLVSLLSGVSNLGSEPADLIGTLEEADVTKRTWRIATPDGKYSGEVNQGGPSLEGLKLGSAYKFSCIEEIEEHEGTGREQRTLYLIEHRPA